MKTLGNLSPHILRLFLILSLFAAPLYGVETPCSLPYQEMFDDPETASGIYNDAVMGELYNDNYQSIAVLEGQEIRVFADPLLYKPQEDQTWLDCAITGNWETMEILPGGNENGEADALVVAGSTGIFVARWSHSQVDFLLTQVASDVGAYRLCVDDLDYDGDYEIVAAIQVGATHIIKIYQQNAQGQWTVMSNFGITGTVQDMITLKWAYGADEKHIAMVQQGEGLDVFSLAGVKEHLSIQLSHPFHPDSLARLDAINPADTDKIVWVTGTGNGTEEYNDQFLFTIKSKYDYQVLYIGTADYTSVKAIDAELDGYPDIVLLSRTAAPFRLYNYEESRPDGPFFGNLQGTIGTEDLEILTVDVATSYDGVRSAFAIGDADYDGDPDAYFAFQDAASKGIHLFRNDRVNHEDFLFERDMEFLYSVWAGDVLQTKLVAGEGAPSWAGHFEIMVYQQSCYGSGFDPEPVTTVYLDKNTLNDPYIEFDVDLVDYFEDDELTYILARWVTYDAVNEKVTRYGPVSCFWLAVKTVMETLPGVDPNYLDVDIFYPSMAPVPPNKLWWTPPPGTGALTGGSGMGSDNDRPATGTGTP